MTDVSGNRPRHVPGVKYVLMLGALAALPALSTDMYLPSLPDVADDLQASQAAVQFTLSAMLIGGGFGQLVIGPLSDRFGRRLPLMVGISLHIVISMACSIAPDIATLIGLRILQGFFNAAAAVVAIAVIRDRFIGSDAARLMSRLVLVIGVAPLFAPSIGQVIADQWHWRAVFYALALIGLVLVIIVWKWMPETLPIESRRGGRPKQIARSYWFLLRDRQFMSLAIVPGLGLGVIMSYVVGSPFVFQNQYGLSGSQFALVFALNGVVLIISAQVNASLVRRVAPAKILRTGVLAQFTFGVVLLLIVVTGAGGLSGVLVGLWLIFATQGMIAANATVLALNNYGHMAGTASAVMGALKSGIAGIISPLVGFLGGGALSMASVMVGIVAVMVTVLLVGTPVYRKGGWRKLEFQTHEDVAMDRKQ
ncbi:multidrug effflux MFS transporter [Arthrobacter monumenti]